MTVLLAAILAALIVNLIALAAVLPKAPGPRRKGNPL